MTEHGHLSPLQRAWNIIHDEVYTALDPRHACAAYPEAYAAGLRRALVVLKEMDEGADAGLYPGGALGRPDELQGDDA
jgi:hypothetical protein